MSRKNRKIRWLIFIVIIAVVAVVVVYRIWNEPHMNIKNATGVKTTATALYSYLSTDSATMKPAFLNKVVIVSGEVTQILKNGKEQQIILLKTNTPVGSVNCRMEEKINHLTPGNTISVKGICSGYIAGDRDLDLPGDVFLTRCYPSN